MPQQRLGVAVLVLVLCGLCGLAARADMVAYWAFDEGQGDVAYDSSRSAVPHHGVLSSGTAMPTWVTGGTQGVDYEFGSGAIRFDGSNDLITVPDHGELRLNGSWALGFWYKFNAEPGSWPGLMGKGNWKNATADGGWGLFETASTDTVNMIKYNDTTGWGAGSASSTQLRHYAASYDSTTSTLSTYLDGVKVGTKTIAYGNNTNAASLLFGKSPDAYSPFNFDDMAIFNTALADGGVGVGQPAAAGSEVARLFSQGAATFRAPAVAGHTGPGGFERTDVPSGLLYWLKADSGVVADGSNNVSAWGDQSSRGNNFAQATAGSQPQLVAGVLNGQPAVRFDGTNDRLTLSSPTTPTTVFIVNSPDQYVWLAGLWGSDNPSDKGIRIDVTTGATAWRHPGDANDFTNGTGGVMYINGTATNTFASYGTPQILSAYRGASHPATYNVTQLGWYYSARVFDGDIAEVLAFNRVLNSAERQIVENYLSAKYDVPLAAGDVYSGDSPLKGDYDFDVFGIGRVNASNVLAAAGAAGLAIESYDGSLGDNEWVMAGHKEIVNSVVDGHWARVWYIDKVGTVNADLTFDFSEAGMEFAGDVPLALMFRASEQSSFTALGLQATVVGDQAMFAVPNALLQPGYYTLSAIPEPGTLALLGLGMAALFGRRRRAARAQTYSSQP